MKKRTNLLVTLIVCLITLLLVFAIACPITVADDDDDDDDGRTIVYPIGTTHAGPWLNPIEGLNPAGGNGTVWGTDWTSNWVGADHCDATTDSSVANNQDGSLSTLGMTSLGTQSDNGGISNLYSSNGATIAYYGATYDPTDTTWDAVDASAYNYLIFYAKFSGRGRDNVKIAVQDKYGRLIAWSSDLGWSDQIAASTDPIERVIIPFVSTAWQDASGDKRNVDSGSIISVHVAPWGTDEIILDEFFFADATDDAIPALP